MTFQLTAKQYAANEVLAGPARHILLRGGSRSGKTFLFVRAIVIRALKAPGSRHAIMRLRFNACKTAIVYDTFPKVMELCFPQVSAKINQSDWFWPAPNGSQVWFGGLDDKERTEKILGQEHATMFLNEVSQIPWASRNTAKTRLAQKVMVKVNGVEPYELPLKEYCDINPTGKSHWSNRLFIQHVDPETRIAIPDPEKYATFKIDPQDNAENLAAGYVESLKSLPARMQRRFLLGEYGDETPGALFLEEQLDKWRILDQQLPDMVRIIVAVDPSGSGDTDNADNDEIGITVQGLGTDGNGYLLEDLTVKAGPATWGRVATSAYDRHRADLIVAETNFGGAMVKGVIDAARPRTPFKAITASRGKVVRAEPIATLVEDGKVRLVGYFPQLEEELGGFTTSGYTGDRSPNRADAFVWGFSELFPGIVRDRKAQPKVEPSAGWAWA